MTKPLYPPRQLDKHDKPVFCPPLIDGVGVNRTHHTTTMQKRFIQFIELSRGGKGVRCVAGVLCAGVGMRSVHQLHGSLRTILTTGNSNHVAAPVNGI